MQNEGRIVYFYGIFIFMNVINCNKKKKYRSGDQINAAKVWEIVAGSDNIWRSFVFFPQLLFFSF